VEDLKGKNTKVEGMCIQNLLSAILYRFSSGLLLLCISDLPENKVGV
jgi:hypothetical protein